MQHDRFVSKPALRVAKPEKVRTGPVFWSGKWLGAISEKQARLAFPAFFSLVTFF
jgi:hypothetical protein